MRPNFVVLRPLLPTLAAAILSFNSGSAFSQTAPNDAEPATRAFQQKALHNLPFQNRDDFDDARHGFIGALPDATVSNADSGQAWSMTPYKFLQSDAPSTVHPSLWRQAQLNAIHGLFKVTDRVYQVRGMDLANMTIVEGDTSLIVIDSLFSVEAAHAALELYYSHRPRKPVGTFIYSHGHVDHFGGVKGIVSEADAASGKVQVIAPQNFIETAVAENVLAGNAMSRRMQYQFGSFVKPGPRGSVDGGLGKALSRGSISLIAPNSTIKQNRERRVIDGVEIIFQLALGSEAPSEMIMYFPQMRVLDMSEVVTHNMHNLYTLRGAEVRDGNAWSQYINDALHAYGNRSDFMISQHHWPTRGKERIANMLEKHRDLYKFINDQTLRLLNQGYTPNEISARLHLPASLEQEWSTRGYYGTLSHNAKAVYQKYLGWYDANPANLNPLPPTEAGKKALEYMGGADAVITRARQDYKNGSYQWVASVMSQVVFADPSNKAARELAADAMEQLGYQAESSMWRSAYLTGALELRNGVPKAKGMNTLNPDTLKAVPIDMYFNFLGARLNADRAEGKKLIINWNFTDTHKQYVLNLSNSALTHTEGAQAPDADATLTLTRDTLDAITLQKTTFAEAINKGLIKTEGSPEKFKELLGMLDAFDPAFAIVEPKKP